MYIYIFNDRKVFQKVAKKKIEILSYHNLENSKPIISTNNTTMSIKSITYSISLATERAHQAMILDSVRQAVEILSERYSFDPDEAMHEMKISPQVQEKKGKKEKKAPVPKKVKPSIPLPFCDKVVEDNCCGIRRNHSLFTQCTNTKTSDSDYCKTCNAQASSNSTTKPKLGDIRDRLADGWEPTGGAKLVSYGNVMEKLGISKDEAINIARQFDMEIPESQFEIVKGKRGRPKKDTSASSSDDEDTKPKRPRGRPKSSKKVVSTSGDDLIATLVKQQMSIAIDTSESADSESEDNERQSPTESIEANAGAFDEAVDEAAVRLEAKKVEEAKAKEAKKVEEANAKKAENASKKALAKAKEAAAAAAAKEEAANQPALTLEDLSDSDSDEEECVVEPVTHEGKVYYKNEDGEILDPDDDNSVVGEWNDETNSIEFAC